VDSLNELLLDAGFVETIENWMVALKENIENFSVGRTNAYDDFENRVFLFYSCFFRIMLA